MNHYLIGILTVSDNDKVFESALKQFSTHLCRGKQNTSPLHTALLTPGCLYNKDTQLWHDITSADDVASILSSLETSRDSNVDLLSECLHQLCDSLPQEGAYIDILWLADDDQPSVEEQVELFGALRRLTTWYNASLTISVSCPTPIDAHQRWASLLGARLTGCDQQGELSVRPHSFVWRGCLIVPTEKEDAPCQLPGFTLEEQILPPAQIKISGLPSTSPVSQRLGEVLLSNSMELIAAVDWRTIPHHLLTSTIYNFVLECESPYSEKSRKLMESLDESQFMSYLVRVKYGTTFRLVTEDSNLFLDANNTQIKSYSQLLLENIKYANENHFVTELTGNDGYFHFLLAGNRHPGNQTRASEDTTQSVFCQAFLLHNFSDLDPRSCQGQILNEMQHSADLKLHSSIHSRTRAVNEETEKENILPSGMNQMTNKEGESVELGREEGKNVCHCVAMEEVLSGLHQLSGENVMELEKQAEKYQASLVAHYIRECEDAGQQVSLEGVATLLTWAHQQVYERYRAGVEQPDVQPLQRYSSAPMPDWARDVGNQLERKALALRYSEAASLNRYQSNESLAGLSPPTKGQFVTIDAGEFLKFFKSDGTAAKTNLSLVPLKKNITKCQSGNEIDSPVMDNWSNTTQYHDIYYNQGNTRDTIQTKSDKLLARLSHIETSTTCILEQAHSPAAMSVVRETTNTDSLNDPDQCDIKVKPSLKRKADGDRDECNGSVKRYKRSDSESGRRKTVTKTTPAAEDTGASSRRLYTARKMSAKEKQDNDSAAAKSRSRSERHKQKLEEVVVASLAGAGVKKGCDIFKSSAQRLYTITKSFVKDLTSSRNLRQEMQKIADMHVTQVVTFEKDRHKTLKRSAKR